MRGIAVMRWGLLAFAVGCSAGVRPAQPPREPANLMDSETFANRISGLRATLARNHIAIDTEPVIETCGGEHHGNRCVRCDVATRDNTGGVDPSLIDGVALAFAVYPPSLLEATKLQHVALCRSIRFQGSDERPPAGVAISEQNRLMISVEYFVDGSPQSEDFTISQVVHHEVFHLFDRATTGEAVRADREWSALNPRGFAYRDPAITAVQRPAGFINTYATTNELEDRATVFEYLLGQPTRLCEIARADPVVAAKTATVWRRVAKVVGDKVLKLHAPCVDWIGKKMGKPPKRGVKLQLAPR
jgi:hypothetical protein